MNQKDYVEPIGGLRRKKKGAARNEKKIFGSFFQKRTASFLCYAIGLIRAQIDMDAFVIASLDRDIRHRANDYGERIGRRP